jgi:NAD(P)-dependent dehydrogenase (short-subunit alcohol dehydrogenase family)
VEDLNGKVAVVTGEAAGIGRGIVIAGGRLPPAAPT